MVELTDPTINKRYQLKPANYGGNKRNGNVRSFVREKGPYSHSKRPRKETVANLTSLELYKGPGQAMNLGLEPGSSPAAGVPWTQRMNSQKTCEVSGGYGLS